MARSGGRSGGLGAALHQGMSARGIAKAKTEGTVAGAGGIGGGRIGGLSTLERIGDLAYARVHRKKRIQSHHR